MTESSRAAAAAVVHAAFLGKVLGLLLDDHTLHNTADRRLYAAVRFAALEGYSGTLVGVGPCVDWACEHATLGDPAFRDVPWSQMGGPRTRRGITWFACAQHVCNEIREMGEGSPAVWSAAPSIAELLGPSIGRRPEQANLFTLLQEGTDARPFLQEHRLSHHYNRAGR